MEELNYEGTYNSIDEIMFTPEHGDYVIIKSNNESSQTYIYINNQWNLLEFGNIKPRGRFEHTMDEYSARYKDAKNSLIDYGFLNALQNIKDRYNSVVETYAEVIDDIVYLYEVYENELCR